MKIHSKIKNYSVDFVNSVFDKKEEIFKNLSANRRFYFIDQKFYEIYKKELTEFIAEDIYLVIEALEPNKSYLKLADYFKFLIDKGFKRSDFLVVFGGGILQDISGFIASTLYRGIKWTFFPTTLLAQADSCIGSKTSINFGENKNLIGTFYPPDFIFIDTGFCDSLTDEYFYSGVGEIIKFHILSNPSKFEILKRFLASSHLRKSPFLKETILSTLEIKRSYFEEDEFDSDRRNLLNYGHTFGHALESASNFAICHGIAVIVGMGMANLLSLKRGLLSKPKYEEFETILKRFYPSIDWTTIGIETLLSFLKKDKKRVGENLTFILVKDIGNHVRMHDVREEEVREVYREFVGEVCPK